MSNVKGVVGIAKKQKKRIVFVDVFQSKTEEERNNNIKKYL